MPFKGLLESALKVTPELFKRRAKGFIEEVSGVVKDISKRRIPISSLDREAFVESVTRKADDVMPTLKEAKVISQEFPKVGERFEAEMAPEAIRRESKLAEEIIEKSTEPKFIERAEPDVEWLARVQKEFPRGVGVMEKLSKPKPKGRFAIATPEEQQFKAGVFAKSELPTRELPSEMRPTKEYLSKNPTIRALNDYLGYWRRAGQPKATVLIEGEVRELAKFLEHPVKKSGAGFQSNIGNLDIIIASPKAGPHEISHSIAESIFKKNKKLAKKIEDIYSKSLVETPWLRSKLQEISAIKDIGAKLPGGYKKLDDIMIKGDLNKLIAFVEEYAPHTIRKDEVIANVIKNILFKKKETGGVFKEVQKLLKNFANKEASSKKYKGLIEKVLKLYSKRNIVDLTGLKKGK